MMALLVDYSAYGRSFNEVFIGGTETEIRNALTEVCSTVVIRSIKTIKNGKKHKEVDHRQLADLEEYRR